VEKVRDNG